GARVAEGPWRPRRTGRAARAGGGPEHHARRAADHPGAGYTRGRAWSGPPDGPGRERRHLAGRALRRLGRRGLLRDGGL
ncbi:MAG: hypothetical protein AVDCRST_MAG72-1871, partial [uncultured Nocardioidaceae bacterium]